MPAMIAMIAPLRLLRRLLRSLLDVSAETRVMEEGLQVACRGFSLASYGIPLAPVWLPELGAVRLPRAGPAEDATAARDS